jgi:AcrR family transcriptional regulator
MGDVQRASVERQTRRRPNPRGEGGRLREDIIAAAVRVIGEVGNVEAVSLRAVAREAGIDPMSVYRHFADKEDLVWAVLDAEFAELARALEATAAPFRDSHDRLRARCLGYVRFGQERPGEFLVLFGTEGRPQPPDGDPELLPGWPVFAALLDDVERCLAPSRTAPADKQAEAEAKATLLWAALHGLTVLRLSKRGFPWPPIEALVDRLLGELELTPP